MSLGIVLRQKERAGKMKEAIYGSFVIMTVISVVISMFILGKSCAPSQIEQRDQESQERLALERYEYLQQLWDILKEKIEIVQACEDSMVFHEDIFAGNPDVSHVLYDEYNRLAWNFEMAKRDYNALATAYNSLHGEYGHRFADESRLPRGALYPLPRSFTLYQL